MDSSQYKLVLQVKRMVPFSSTRADLSSRSLSKLPSKVNSQSLVMSKSRQCSKQRLALVALLVR